METLKQTIEGGNPVAKFKGKTLAVGTAPELLKQYAEIIELKHYGDTIGYRVLAKQLGLKENVVAHALSKYKPIQGTRHIVILLQSKLNDEWGEGDYPLKEKPAED